MPERIIGLADVVAMARRIVTGEPACPCTQLLRVLAPKERLPADLDHVCPETMMASTLLWQTLPHWGPGASGQAVPETAWPVRYAGGRRLLFVINQWAIEEPTTALANKLRDDGTWRALVQVVREDQRLRDILSGAGVQTLEDGVAYLCAQFHALHWLRGLGLPATPDILRRLLDEAEGRPTTDTVARGVLLSTLVFADPLRFGRPHDGNPETVITGALDAETILTVGVAVKRIGDEHQEWLARFSQAPFTTDAARRRASLGIGPPAQLARDELDAATAYLKEATSQAAIVRIAKGVEEGASRAAAVEEEIAEAADRVYKRLRRRGLHTAPPKGWKTRARAVLERELDARGLRG